MFCSWLWQEHSLVCGSLDDFYQGLLISSVSSSIIQDIEAICKTDEALMGYFYFDPWDTNKQHWRNLISSLLNQLSSRSGACYDILLRLYSNHDSGTRRSSDDLLTKCLIEMLSLSDQRQIYLIIDALDESPNTTGMPTPRERVLQFVEDLVNLRLTNLHICVTSRPEIDVRNVLESLTSCQVSLHDQSGQKKDIEAFVWSVVYSDTRMKRWKQEDKDLVIKTLSERADGM